MARPWPVVLLLLLVPGVAANAADVPTVWVPDAVVGDRVPFVVGGLVDETEANLTVAGASVVLDVTGVASGGGVLAGVPPGLHAWTVNVTDGTDLHTVSGTVFVQNATAAVQARLDALAAVLDGASAELDAVANQTAGIPALAGLPDRLTALETALAAVGADLSGIPDQGQDPQTAAALAGIDADVRALADAVAEVKSDLEADDAAPTASLADPVGRAGSLTTVLLVLGLGGFVAFSQVQAQRRRREVMVLLLALAARMQVSPESEEFRSAVEALDA